MAQEQESSSTSTSIPRVGKHSKGYDPRQVDAFVAHTIDSTTRVIRR